MRLSLITTVVIVLHSLEMIKVKTGMESIVSVIANIVAWFTAALDDIPQFIDQVSMRLISKSVSSISRISSIVISKIKIIIFT